MKKFLSLLLFIVCMLTTCLLKAEDLTQVSLSDENLLLVEAKLAKTTISQNVDVYTVGSHILVAMDPLFEGLKLRYQLRQNKLQIWKDEQVFEFNFLNTTNNDDSHQIWATDGFYQFIDLSLLESLFESKFILDKRKLLLNIESDKFTFPVQTLAEIAKQRAEKQAFAYDPKQQIVKSIPITIADQYRLATLPHGEIYSRLALDNNNQSNNTNIRLTSDLLYHSAKLNLQKRSGNNITGGLSLSRYKTTPDELLLGLFDSYSIGDVSSYAGGGLVTSGAGVGITLQRQPFNYRRDNTQITIQQSAPPGWQADLYRNNTFIASSKVPETGLLVFENTEIFYGNNNFVIKVYGPYGEINEYKQDFPLYSNSLSEGDIAYGISILDPRRSLFNNDQTDGGLSFDSFSATFDYGINDRWQIGTSFSSSPSLLASETSREEFVSLKNNLSFPGFLIQNEIAVNTDNKYKQETSISASLFGDGALQLKYESNNGLVNSYRSINDIDSRLNLSYFDTLYDLPYRIGMTYSKNGDISTKTVSNSFYYNWNKIKFTHNLYYHRLTNNNAALSLDNERWMGSILVSGSPFDDVNLTVTIPYEISGNSSITDSSQFELQWNALDPWDLRHYVSLSYQPLTNSENSWQLAHSLAYETNDYRLSLSSTYNQSNNWSFGLNINFFLGYDYYNNRALMSGDLPGATAMLNVHSYLDRHINGVPDVLDYNLEGVEFEGLPEWNGLKSGKEGRVLLPGVPPNTPFKFKATWLNGTATINNDYSIYTHPGARVDVNMPFYLSTEFSGFVFRQAEEGELPLNNIEIQLMDRQFNIIKTATTDSDGYYEFTNMKPNSYQVKIATSSLRKRALTADIIGFNITTPSKGGFFELPSLYIRQQKTEIDTGTEKLTDLSIKPEDVELLVWDDKQQNDLFTLPTKQKVKARHSLDNAKDESDINAEKVDSQINENQKNKQAPPTQTIENVFTIQLGAFTDKNIAIKFIDNFPQFSNAYSIVESSNKNGLTIYHLVANKFRTAESATEFARSRGLRNSDFMVKQFSSEKIEGSVTTRNTPIQKVESNNNVVIVSAVPKNIQTNSALKDGWVIQLYASKSPIDPIEAKQFSSIGPIYMAQKVQTSGEKWFCLISQTYETKAEALNAQQKANVRGWPLQYSTYTVSQKVN